MTSNDLDFKAWKVYSSYGSYSKYVGTKFEREPFKAGGTCTHEALRRVRSYDLRGGRSGTDKFVMVFTDGASQDPSRTASEARALQNSGRFSNVVMITSRLRHDDVISEPIMKNSIENHCKQMSLHLVSELEYNTLSWIVLQANPKMLARCKTLTKLKIFLGIIFQCSRHI